MSDITEPRKATRRDACDKCHALKTRCDKPAGSATCQRCERLEVECVSSPALRSGRPQGSSGSVARNGTGRGQRPRSPPSKRLRNSDGLLQRNFEKAQSEDSTTFEEIGTSTSLPPTFGFDDTSGQTFHHQQSPPNAMERSTFDLTMSEGCTVFDDCDGVGGEDFSSFLNILPLPDTQPLAADGIESDSDYAKISSSCTYEQSMTNATGASHAMHQSDEYISQLLDLQMELVGLHKSFSGSLQYSTRSGVLGRAAVQDVFKDIEHTYAITQQFIDMVQRAYGPMRDNGNSHLVDWLPTPASTRHNSSASVSTSSSFASSTKSSPLSVSTVLTIISCYTRLIQIYDLMVQTLHDQDVNASSSSKSSYSSTTSGSAISEHQIPYFRMPHSRLAVPPTATLGMHLVLVISMDQQLKDSMRHCVSACHTQRVASTDGIAGPRDDLPRSTGENPASALMELAMSETSLREKGLARTLQKVKSRAGLL